MAVILQQVKLTTTDSRRILTADGKYIVFWAYAEEDVIIPEVYVGGGGRYGTAQKSYNELWEYHKRWKRHIKRRVKKRSTKKLIELGRFPLIEELKKLQINIEKDPIIGLEKLIDILPYSIVDRALTDISKKLKEQQDDFEELPLPPKRFKLDDELVDDDLIDPPTEHEDELFFDRDFSREPKETTVLVERVIERYPEQEALQIAARMVLMEMLPIIVNKISDQIEDKLPARQLDLINEDELKLVIQELIT